MLSFVAGDLKLVEKPQPVVMSPHDFTNIKASVKVASTENGIIFGNIGQCSFFCLLLLQLVSGITSVNALLVAAKEALRGYVNCSSRSFN